MDTSEEIAMTIFGVLAAVLGLAGLFLAAKAQDGGISLFGTLLFLFAVLFDFWLLKRYYDARDAA